MNHWTYNRYRASLCLNGRPVAILANLSGKDIVERELADLIVNALNEPESNRSELETARVRRLAS